MHFDDFFVGVVLFVGANGSHWQSMAGTGNLWQGIAAIDDQQQRPMLSAGISDHRQAMAAIRRWCLPCRPSDRHGLPLAHIFGRPQS